MRRRTFLSGAAVAGGAATVAGVTLGWPPGRLLAAGKGPSRAASLLERLRRAGLSVGARFSRHGGARPAQSLDVPLTGSVAHARLDDVTWTCALRVTAVRGAGAPGAPSDAVDLLATFKVQKGTAAEASVGLKVAFASWSRDNYVLLPGACYAGNRFESRHTAYPPLLTEPADIGPNVPAIVSDIPRLNIHAGPSRLSVLAADLATPGLAVHAPGTKTGVVVLTDVATGAGLSGLTLEESDDRASAEVLVSAPGWRDEAPYASGGRARAVERGGTFRPGAEISVRLRVYLFECPELSTLFERFVTVRKELTGPTARPHELPFSAAFKAHEERANQRWVDTAGFFAVGARDTAYSTWQTGWGGGLVSTLPLLGFGEPRSRARALRNLNFIFAGGQAPSGFFHSIHDGKDWIEDGFTAPRRASPDGGRRAPSYKHARKWHLVRRSADALTFTVKQLQVLARQEPAFKPDSRWLKGVTRCADAFVRLWDRYKQLGQYVNVDTGELIVGGSTAAGIAPAGLALAAGYLQRDDCLAVANAAAEQMYERFVRVGVTCGGPGDALQCPDSESAAGLLESFVTLFEQTGERVWLDRATAMAHQLTTWVISYDVRVPASGQASPDAIAPLRSSGAVFSNAQNRRGAPGFGGLSGDALFRLYRATGETQHLHALRDTVHNLAQYLPRGPRVERAAPDRAGAGPRADTSDWVDGASDVVAAGNIFDATCLLAYTEIPGVYVRTTSGFVFAFDHVDVRLKRTPGRLNLTLTNPTPVSADVRVLAESDAEAARPLGPAALLAARLVTVPAGGSTEVDLDAPAESAP